MIRGASFSSCNGYRYRLWRYWSLTPQQTILWLMLNPSTADGQQDDPTIRRCINYSRAWGYTNMEVGNLFAWRTTRPNELLSVTDPVGPENDNILRQQIRRADFIMLGWGAHGHYHARDVAVLQILKRLEVPLYCLGVTRNGAPKHPLYLKKTLLPVAFNVDKALA